MRINALGRMTTIDPVRSNPTWTNAALFRHWDELEAYAGKEWMPRLTERTAKRLAAEEFGTGNYGTVMPTKSDGIVCKITSDVTEAKFVAAALSMKGHWPSGMIRYYGVVQLRGNRGKRPTYALWRDEAAEVGQLQKYQSFDRSGGRSSWEVIADEFGLRLLQFKINAAAARDVFRRSKSPAETMKVAEHRARNADRGEMPNDIVQWSYREQEIRQDVQRRKGVDRAVRCLSICRSVAQIMQDNAMGYRVGEALERYLDAGVLLADVHHGNIGFVEGDVAVITDPGHAVFLTNAYDGVRVVTIDEKTTMERIPRAAV